ncbi:hypothetical protein KDL44_11125 [bacterium]|nr:hypothetical protein [bacterium]
MPAAMRPLSLLLLLLSLSDLSGCSTPTVPDMQDNTQKFVDELEWFELSGLQQLTGLAPEQAWVAAALDEQLRERQLLLPVEKGSLQAGVADIQLRYDEVPLPASWSSPPGELELQGSLGLLDNRIDYSPDPELPSWQQQVEHVALSGSFQLASAESVLRQAEALRASQPLVQTNPETHETWLLGRSISPFIVNWEFSGTLGGTEFSFSAIQELVAVSSYYELRLLESGSPQEARAAAALRHRRVLEDQLPQDTATF